MTHWFYYISAIRTRSGLLRRSTAAVALFLALAQVPYSTSSAATKFNRENTVAMQQASLVFAAPETKRPRIQLAILLDTSSSMDGLIDQTRNQLWQVVNEFSGARQNGVTPILEIALFEYGNNGNSASDGYVRMLNGFTSELDRVSESLFSLTTDGGSEYCGYAIKTAVTHLQWSHSDSDIKTIFIAGNEAFAQGPVRYQEAIQLARHYGVSVNTIHAGDYQQGVDGGWRQGAVLAGGDYMSIDADRKVVHIAAPQDARIAELNARLNNTYIPYGSSGAANALRQTEQDSLSSQISGALLSKRARSKASSFYRNSDWDLVDALCDGAVAEDQLEELEEQTLPEPMQGLTSEQKLGYIHKKALEREKIQREISDLSESRANYIATKKRQQTTATPSISDAMTGAVRKEAGRKNFVF